MTTTQTFRKSTVREYFESVAWTPPTLVGHTLYVRDRRSIVALDVGTS